MALAALCLTAAAGAAHGAIVQLKFTGAPKQSDDTVTCFDEYSPLLRFVGILGRRREEAGAGRESGSGTARTHAGREYGLKTEPRRGGASPNPNETQAGDAAHLAAPTAFAQRASALRVRNWRGQWSDRNLLYTSTGVG